MFTHALDRIAAHLFRASSGPAVQVDPYYAHLWETLERALRDGRFYLTPHRQAWHNCVDLVVHPDDYIDRIRPFKAQFDVALEDMRAELFRSLGYPADAEVAVAFVTANLAMEPLERGTARAVMSTVADPGRRGPSPHGQTQAVTVLGPELPSRASAPPTAMPAPASSGRARARGTPLVRLRWTDAIGARSTELAGPGTFGRGDGEVPTQMEAGPAAEDNDRTIVSRDALAFDVCPLTNRARVKNVGRVPLHVVSASGEAELRPEAARVLDGGCTLVWPGKRGPQGFRLEVDAPIDGEARLRGPRGAQSVVLRAPRSEVRGDPGRVGVDGISLTVDFAVSDGNIVIKNRGSVAWIYGVGERVSPGGDLAPPRGAIPHFLAGDVRIDLVIGEQR